MFVIPEVPKANSLFNESNTKSFKILTFVYKWYHIAFGLDFGFIKQNNLKTKLLKLISFVKSLLLCYLCANDVNIFDNIIVFFWIAIFLIHYIINVFLLLHKSEVFCSLLKDLQIIDLSLKVDKPSYYLEIKLVSALCTSFIYRVVVQCVYFGSTGNCLLPFEVIVLLTLIVQCADVIRITHSFVYYAVYCRLKVLISMLESPNADITYMQHIYKSLVDLVEKHKAEFNILFLVSLAFYIPNAMLTIYSSVLELSRVNMIVANLPHELCLEYATMIATSVMTLLPALSAGALTSQASKLKLMLHDKILEQQDEGSIREIERFIGYVNARGCRFYVCQVIPLDADLLGMVLGFCVTYLIVIVQFTGI